MIAVKQLMAKQVCSVSPDTPLMEASQVLFGRNFNRLPVVDKNNKLVGLLTEYDFIAKGTRIHLPTFLKLLSEFDIYNQDRALIKDELKQVLTTTVKDVMNKEPLALSPDSTLDDAVKAFAEHHRVNPIPVVNTNNEVVGVLSRSDVIKFYAGERMTSFQLAKPGRDIDARMDRFLQSFRGEFTWVSKTRTRWWLVFAALFAIVGFIIAFVLIVRIVP